MSRAAAARRTNPPWVTTLCALLVALALGCCPATGRAATRRTSTGRTVTSRASKGQTVTRRTSKGRTVTRRTSTGQATVPTKLSAAFIPLRLGQRTTLEFGFTFTLPSGQLPPPLTGIELRYPNNLGLGLSGLGLATCTVPMMEEGGPGGCSPNAVMGFGEVLTGVVLGSQIVDETAPITIMRAPNQEGRLAVLFYAEGTTPVDARIIFPGLLLPTAAPFGGVVNIGIPLVATLPDAPDVSVINLHSTIGPRKVVYYEQVGGRTLAYRPRGILLPDRCPRAGFPFEARFSFANGAQASARTTIRCPPRKRRR